MGKVDSFTFYRNVFVCFFLSIEPRVFSVFEGLFPFLVRHFLFRIHEGMEGKYLHEVLGVFLHQTDPPKFYLASVEGC